LKKIIYDDAGREHLVGSASNWTEVFEVCGERGLPIHPVGSEGPDAFYVTPKWRGPRPIWSQHIAGTA
jgi:hypothetical protein